MQDSYQSIGQIQIADDVIAVIIGTAAMEVEGVAAGKTDLSDMLSKKNLAKGVSLTVENGEVKADLLIVVKFGFKIQEVCLNVQKNVKNAIETMTGLVASEINVSVNSLHMDKQKA